MLGASSSLLVCNPCAWVNDCRIVPARCTCVGWPEHAAAAEQGLCCWGGPHALRGESWGWVGNLRCSQTCAFIWALLTCWLTLLVVGRDGGPRPAWVWKRSCFPLASWSSAFSPSTPVGLSKPRKRLLSSPLSSRRCEVEPGNFKHYLPWPGCYPHTKTSPVILGLRFHLAAAASVACVTQRRGCHPAVCPNGTAGDCSSICHWFWLLGWAVL